MRKVIASLLCLTLVTIMLLPGAKASEGSWSAEVRLSLPYPSTANDIEVAVNDNGSAIAAWNMWDASHYLSHAWVALFDPQKGWTSGTMLDSSSVGSSIMCVRITAEGVAAVAWSRDTGSSEYPVVAMYLPGSGWQTPAQLSTYQSDRIYTLEVAIDGAGDAVSIWDSTVGTTFHIYTSAFSTSSGWDSAQELISSPNLHSYVIAGISESGMGLVTWKERVELPGPIYQGFLWYSSYDPLSGWSTASKVRNEEMDSGGMEDMAVDGKGNAVLAYGIYNSTSHAEESYATYYNGNVWMPPTLLSANDGLESACPDVDLTKDGWGMVVWGQWNGGIKQYQYRVVESGAFGPIQIVPQETVKSMNWPYLDVSEGKHAILTTNVVWEGETKSHAYAVRYSPSAGWSEWERLDKNSLNDIYFLVRGGIDRNGDAAVAWISYDDSSIWNMSIRASTYSSGTVEVDLQREVNDLKGELSLALMVAVIATVIAVISLALLFRRKGG